MDPLSLEQQKQAISSASKTLLWEILEEEGAWLKVLGVLPREYFDSFLSALRRAGVTGENTNKVRAHASMFVKNKVSLPHLQAALVQAWNPSDLKDSASWLKEKGFLSTPLSPLTVDDKKEIVKSASSVPSATKERMLRQAGGKKPRSNHPPDGASLEGRKLWNRVLRNPGRRKIIFGPKSLSDQWSLATKFWLKECADQGVAPYKSDAESSSKSMHAQNVISRAMQELHGGLCYDGYSMSRPAARAYKKLWRQLARDGVSLGSWTSIKPKRKI